MNARLAVEENERLIKELISQAIKIHQRLGISVIDAIDYLTGVAIKNAPTESSKAAWEIRGQEARKKY
jgi:hypothetical protein